MISILKCILSILTLPKSLIDSKFKNKWGLFFNDTFYMSNLELLQHENVRQIIYINCVRHYFWNNLQTNIRAYEIAMDVAALFK